MARPDFRQRIADARAQRAAQDRVRARRTATRRDGVRFEVDGRWLTGFCGNDYLGLSQHFAVVNALQDTAAREGAGGISSHLVCGHHAVHAALEREVADWLGVADALLFGSGFMANLAVVQALLGDDDLCVQDRLNHASLVDAARLAGCRLRRYPHADAEGALRQLRGAPEGAALLATDGVFSMDGYLAPLDEICALADRHDALVMVDDSHAVGFVGEHGGGTPELFGVQDRVDVVTGTLGKALGGASGGYVSGRGELVALLRQRSRPYLFSNAVAPVVAAASITAIDLAESSGELRARLRANTARFRARMTAEGFELPPGEHPITPVMIGDAATAGRMADLLLDHGVYAIGFSYPVVPQGKARIRIQLSAAHSLADVDTCVDAFVAARAALAA